MTFHGYQIPVRCADTQANSLSFRRAVFRMARIILIAVLTFAVLAEPRVCHCDGHSFGFVSCPACPVVSGLAFADDHCGLPERLPLHRSCPQGGRCACEFRVEMLGDSTTTEVFGRRSSEGDDSDHTFHVPRLSHQAALRLSRTRAHAELGMMVQSGRERLLAHCLLLC